MRSIFLLVVVLLVAMTACTGMSGSAAPTPTFAGLTGNGTPTPTAGRGIITPTAPYPYMEHLGLKEYTLLTNEQLGDISPRARVRIDLAYVLDGEVVYAITAMNGESFEEVHQDQIVPIYGAIPGLTLTAQVKETHQVVSPTPVYQWANGMDIYGLITLGDVSDIPQGTLVQLMYIRYEADGTVRYGIRMEDGRSSEARQEQLALAPGVTPGPTATRPAPTLANMPPQPTQPSRLQPTSTAAFGTTDGGPAAPTPTAEYAFVVGTQSYILIAAEQIGPIRFGELVRLAYSLYDGNATHYGIVTADGRTAVAREDQLAFAPRGSGTWVPTQRPGWPDPTPTFEFFDLPFTTGSGDFPLTPLVSRDGVIAGEPVRTGSAHYDGEYVIYQVVTADGRTAVYKQHELRLRPDFTPQPTPTWYATSIPSPTHDPREPTPTSIFDADLRAGGVIFYTLVHVSADIPIGTRVQITSAYYDGQDWLYTITAVDTFKSGAVRDYHLSRTPPPPGPQPTLTWTPSPNPPNTPAPTMTFTPLPTPTPRLTLTSEAKTG